MPSPKPRLDGLLVARGLADTRTRAQALIRTGAVTVNGQVFDKPGMPVAEDAAIEVRASLPYVGRGGYKLAAALDAFDLDPVGRACLDVGSSTGGFTDVLLQRSARHVYAVDVGRGQLAWRLREDARVTVMEQTDIRNVDTLPESISLVAVDVAFISLKLVLPAVKPLLAPDADVVALIKPQFEAGRAEVGKGGIVRDVSVQLRVVAELTAWVEEHGWRVIGKAIASPITGTDGNQEYLVRLQAAAG